MPPYSMHVFMNCFLGLQVDGSHTVAAGVAGRGHLPCMMARLRSFRRAAGAAGLRSRVSV